MRIGLLIAMALFCGTAGRVLAQVQLVECGSYCEWTEVSIVQEVTNTKYNIKSVLSFAKTEKRQSLNDFAATELKKIKKKARKYNTCTVIMTTKAPEEKTGLRAKQEYIYFYIVKPVIPIGKEDKL